VGNERDVAVVLSGGAINGVLMELGFLDGRSAIDGLPLTCLATV
jgi:hypothetical protein